MFRLYLALSAACAACASADARRSNFVFFQPDEMRAESLGCYGHPVSKTPNFDAFAAQGTRFDQCHVSYAVCSQSRVAFMTGWPTHVRGHRTLWSLLHDWEPNMLKYFKRAGYDVRWWGKNDLLAPDAFNASVTSAYSRGGDNNGPNSFKPGETGYFSFLNDPTVTPTNETSDYANVAEAIAYIANHRAGVDPPFTLFLPLTKPHPPYSAPEPFYSSIDPDALPPLRPVPSARDAKPDYHALIRHYRDLTALGEAFFRKVHAVYLGSITFSDFLFGLLLAALDDAKLADSTTVAVWADHGDYAGDYGLVEKWPSGLEDVLTRVPLIVRTPGGAKGHVVAEPVQLFDIVPTFLELAGINLTHVQFGVSQAAQILYGFHGDPERTVFAEGGYATNEPRDFEGDASTGGVGAPTAIYYPKLLQQQQEPLSVCRSASARTLTHKLVFRTDPQAPDHHSELYDLVADPHELHNVYGNASYAAVQAQLKEKLFLWMMQTSDVTPWLEDPRGGNMPFNPPFREARRHAADVAGDTPPTDDVVWHV